MPETAAAVYFGWIPGCHHCRIPLQLLLLLLVMTMMKLPLVRGVYFTELSYRSVIPASMSVGEEALVMRVHSTPSVGHPSAIGADVDCALERVHSSSGGGGRGQDVRPVDWPFHVAPAQAEPGAFRILVALPLDVELRSDKVTYHLRVGCTDKTNGIRTNSNVTINVFRDDEWRQASERTSLCHHDVTFQLAENVRNVVLGTLWCSARQLCRQNEQRANCSLTVQGVKNNEFYDGYLILEDSGQLTVERSFDRETVDRVTIAYLCSSSSSPSSSDTGFTSSSSSSRRSSAQRRHFCGATINILDTNDQGPWFHKLRQGPLKYLETRVQLVEQKTTLLTTIATSDKDLLAANEYIAYLENDYDGRVSVSRPKRVLDNGHGVYFNTDVFVRGGLDLFRKDSLFFDVVVYIRDASFIESFNADDNDTAIYRIKVQWQPLWTPVAHHADSPIVFISSSASVFSRVYYLGMSAGPYLLEATCDDAPSCDVRETAFAVTSREGIVYVSDARLLRDLVNRTTVIVVRNCSSSSSSSSSVSTFSFSSSSLDPGGVCSVFLNLTVFVAEDSGPKTSNESPEYNSCSGFYFESSCELALGLGAPTGACVWRSRSQPEADSLTGYETCSPDLVTCPDGHCDELEMNVTELCPQDCTTNAPDGVGWAELNHGYAPPRGIFRAQGPCWCTGTQCRCGLSSGNTSANETQSPEMSVQDAIDGCGATCRLMLLVGLSSVLVLTLTFVIWKCFYSRRKVKRMHRHGSGIVPSDYTVAPGSVNTDYTDYGTGHLLDVTRQNVLDVQDDPKWEFNRQYVRFESVLGEGEFGKVVKAKAWEIQGLPGYTTVAVKMLKECASAVEYRDLLSELNLLKLISHRNVIKLLGVCSRKGPLYVIVEFCEHGSLRCFLRRVRGRRERGGGDGEGRGVGGGEGDGGGGGGGAGDDDPSESAAGDDLVAVTAQDLLSFSWQIAKGMDYLSGVKVVHRDLAARNILLAAGMVVKISDFGLSRDIYEEDAYLKTSKGPLPVKWMAPESLYDQICTTKSDIWSYGVVLWEIYTLGANPYPGTPAERLYQLLKTGYRMTKPPSCSDELFSVMIRCWADDPSRRPTFSQLAETFEQFLSLDKDYLDLSVCESVLPEEQSTYASGSIGDDDDAVRPAPLANGHYRVPRSTIIATADPAAAVAGEVSPLTVGGHAIPPEFCGSDGKDSTSKKNSPLIPLRSSRNNDQKAPMVRTLENGGGFLCLENRERVKKVEEVEEESNALLARSTKV